MSDELDDHEGFMDFDNPDNPFAGYTVVFVPYCTGDVFLGNATHEYAPDLTVEHKGYINGTTALQYLADTYRTTVAVALTAATAGPMALASSTSSEPDPLGCDALVFDPNGVLAASTVESARAQTAIRLGADVRVRVEGTLDGGLEARWAQLRRQCDGWEVDGDVAPDLVVMMFSTSEREASVYYGADQGPALESRWSDAVDAMTARFADGDSTQGVRDGLSTLRGIRPVDSSLSAPATRSDDRGNDDSGRFIGLLVIVLIAIVVLAAVGKANGWSSSGDSSRSASTSSSNRRSSSWFSGSSSSGRSRSSSRSSRSSGGGSRRSGGGTKKW